jgi:hypothetical protein
MSTSREAETDGIRKISKDSIPSEQIRERIVLKFTSGFENGAGKIYGRTKVLPWILPPAPLDLTLNVLTLSPRGQSQGQLGTATVFARAITHLL